MGSIILDMIHHKYIIIPEYRLLVAATLRELKSMCGRLDLDDIWAINPQIRMQYKVCSMPSGLGGGSLTGI